MYFQVSPQAWVFPDVEAKKQSSICEGAMCLKTLRQFDNASHA
jgi:hypothetical protein